MRDNTTCAHFCFGLGTSEQDRLRRDRRRVRRNQGLVRTGNAQAPRVLGRVLRGGLEVRRVPAERARRTAEAGGTTGRLHCSCRQVFTHSYVCLCSVFVRGSHEAI